MSELIEVLTKDGTYSLRSSLFQENFHSWSGALEEAKIKFINPSNLRRFNNKSLNVLDICFGLGYNSAELFNELIKQNSYVNWYALEIDKRPLKYILMKKSFEELWNPKIHKIFELLYRKNVFEDESFKCKIIWGDAREKINNIPSSIKFDLIYLDGFSPQKCPQLWTVEFLSKVTKKLKPQGYLITYTTSAAVRKTLRELGLEIFSIKQDLNTRKLWSQGTVAVAKFNQNRFKPNCFFDKLTQMEEEHLLTKASVPYRDNDLTSNKEEIIQKRLHEQSISNFRDTKKWREKWK